MDQSSSDLASYSARVWKLSGGGDRRTQQSGCQVYYRERNLTRHGPLTQGPSWDGTEQRREYPSLGLPGVWHLPDLCGLQPAQLFTAALL